MKPKRAEKRQQELKARVVRNKERALDNYVRKKIAKARRNELFESLGQTSFVSNHLSKSCELGRPKKSRVAAYDCERQTLASSLSENFENCVSTPSDPEILSSSNSSSASCDDYDFLSSEEDVEFNHVSPKRQEEAKHEKHTPLVNPLEAYLRKFDTFFVPIHDRSEDIQLGRVELPIFQEESSIMEAIRMFPILLLTGETGSGKTTQVPQFLYENGYSSPQNPNPGMRGKICITQPRRLAAVSMSARLAVELGETHGKYVGYQVRYDTQVTAPASSGHESCRIVYVTDGILLQEIARDFLLKDWSVIIIDEAHERSVNTDILLGLLSRICAYREQEYFKAISEDREPTLGLLKLIIMSATLSLRDFTASAVFKKDSFPSLKYLCPRDLAVVLKRPEEEAVSHDFPPTIAVSGRQYPVSIHFNKVTPYNYLEEAKKKVVQIHAKLPFPGNILVFVSGKSEIYDLIDLLHHHASSDYLGENDCYFEDESSSDDSDNVPLDYAASDSLAGIRLKLIPLYASLSISDQMKLYSQSSSNERMCFIATNVAETSITLPGITYVVDTGKVKSVSISSLHNSRKFEVSWICKASADQRAGRAGRLSPGHCYRLYSSAIYNDIFEDTLLPEIMRTPLIELVLKMKSMSIDDVSSFPFISPPDALELIKAESFLFALEALRRAPSANHFSITDLGIQLSFFPIKPSLAKMLLTCISLQDCPMNRSLTSLCLTLVSILSVGEVFISDNRVKLFLSPNRVPSDMSVLLNAFHSYLQQPVSGRSSWCESVGIKEKSFRETQLLRLQLKKIVARLFPSVLIEDSLKVNISVDLEERLMIIFLSCNPFNIARLEDRHLVSKHKSYQLLTVASAPSSLPTSLQLLVDQTTLQPELALINRNSSVNILKTKDSAGYSSCFVGYENMIQHSSGLADFKVTKKSFLLQNCFRIKDSWIFDHLGDFVLRKGNGLNVFGNSNWPLKSPKS